MKILLVYNASDRRCGFQNFGTLMTTALRRAGCEVEVWDGTYPLCYARREAGTPQFLPESPEGYDVVQVIWNAITLNHYAGADWSGWKTSFWDGGPSDASCPFLDAMQIRWSDYPRDGYHYLDYPVPDWVDNLPPPADDFTVGASSIRGDGVALIREICERRGWAVNLPEPGVWTSPEDEIRRLAKSTVNVCWYHTPPIWHNRASAPSMLLASGRPLVINRDPLTAHLHDARDIYCCDDLEAMLTSIYESSGRLLPGMTANRLSWTRAATRFVEEWSR